MMCGRSFVNSANLSPRGEVIKSRSREVVGVNSVGGGTLTRGLVRVGDLAADHR